MEERLRKCNSAPERNEKEDRRGEGRTGVTGHRRAGARGFLRHVACVGGGVIRATRFLRELIAHKVEGTAIGSAHHDRQSPHSRIITPPHQELERTGAGSPLFSNISLLLDEIFANLSVTLNGIQYVS